MKDMGFQERVINESIKELLKVCSLVLLSPFSLGWEHFPWNLQVTALHTLDFQVYGEDHWFMIENENYDPLLSICLEKQEEKNKQLAKNKNEEMAEDKNEVIVREQMAEKEQANQLAGEEQANQLAENQNEEMAEDQNELIAEEEQVNQLAGVENQEEEKVICFSSFSFSLSVCSLSSTHDTI